MIAGESKRRNPDAGKKRQNENQKICLFNINSYHYDWPFLLRYNP